MSFPLRGRGLLYSHAVLVEVTAHRSHAETDVLQGRLKPVEVSKRLWPTKRPVCQRAPCRESAISEA